MITVTVLAAAAGMAPHVLAHPDRGDTLEPTRLVDQDPLTLGQDSVVGGVPSDPETLGDPGNDQVLAHDALQGPPQSPTRQLPPRFGDTAGVLPPHVPAAAASVAAHEDLQQGGSPAQRLVRQPTGHRVARGALAAATPAPPLIRAVGLDHTTGQHGTVGFESLTGDLESEFIKSAEGTQISTGEASTKG